MAQPTAPAPAGPGDTQWAWAADRRPAYAPRRGGPSGDSQPGLMPPPRPATGRYRRAFRAGAVADTLRGRPVALVERAPRNPPHEEGRPTQQANRNGRETQLRKAPADNGAQLTARTDPPPARASPVQATSAAALPVAAAAVDQRLRLPRTARYARLRRKMLMLPGRQSAGEGVECGNAPTANHPSRGSVRTVVAQTARHGGGAGRS